jgi:capsular exopolysaccharide synthesis family protein
MELQRIGPAARGPRPVAVDEWASAAAQPPSQLLEYWYVLRTNIGWISLLTAAGATLGWLVATMQPAMYQSRTVLDIRSLNEDFLNPREGSPIGATGSVLPESYIQTEIKILSSDSLRKRALDRLQGVQQPSGTQASDSPSFWQSLFRRFDPATVPLKTLAADAARRVKVRAVGNTRIVEVLCDARDGQLAANICNNLARTYIEYNLESRYQSTKETGDWLQSQLDDVRKRLTKAENDLKDSSKETVFLFDSDSADNPAQDKLRQLQIELSHSEGERISKQSDYEVAASQSVDSLPLALDSGPIREYRVRLTELKRQLAEMTATMTPEHYKVRELTMEIAEVENALNKERSDLINRLKADYETAKRRESILANAYNKQEAAASEHGDKAVRYNMLKRDVDSDRKLYETLLQKVDEVGLAAALRTSTISVVDPAVAATHPYSPNVLANVGIGLFGGSILGLAFSFLNVRSDRTLHGPGEASSHLPLRELGVIPSVRKRHRGLLLGSARSSSAKSELSSLKLQDAFFGTMSSLLFATQRGERAGVIVLTSPEAGEGKTTVSTNLAIALAQIGRRVILVDGDLRQPRLDEIFGTSCEGGIAELLESEDPVEEIPLADFVFKTSIPNLSVLPTRAAGEGICKKLHSARMRALVERLRREFDSVIIDSPPMLHIADARVLGWLADGVLLVLRARKTTRESAFAAYDCLVQDGIHVLGTVLNDWNPQRRDRYGAYKAYPRVS